jgi:hypothetical protein
MREPGVVRLDVCPLELSRSRRSNDAPGDAAEAESFDVLAAARVELVGWAGLVADGL